MEDRVESLCEAHFNQRFWEESEERETNIQGSVFDV
jgi:hypothetical protein